MTSIDPTTEIASGFKVERYRELRPRLDPAIRRSAEWSEVIDAFRRRIEERFLRPIDHLAQLRRNADRAVPGFAILALDCLLIDTLQSLREGRVSTGDTSPANSFKSFLRSPRFRVFSGRDREDFFHYVRNGLLHNGEIRGSWKVRVTSEMLTRASNGTRTINRRLFHAAIVEEFEDYCGKLDAGDAALRTAFLRRMDAICGVPVETESLYFAYGAHLLESELSMVAPSARPEGIAFVPGYRVSYNRHRTEDSADLANVEESVSEVLWGYVSADERARIGDQHSGGGEVTFTALLADGESGCRNGSPIQAFTVQGPACSLGCGPDPRNIQLTLQGARDRKLPDSYIEIVRRFPRS